MKQLHSIQIAPRFFSRHLLARGVGLSSLKWVVGVAFTLHLTSANAQLSVQWAKVTGSQQFDYASSLALAPSGEIYLAGNLDGATEFAPNTVLYKFDSDGNQIKRQAGRGEVIQAVAVDSKGNYLLTGYVIKPETLGVGQRNQFYLAKYSPSGTLLWERTGGLPAYVQGLYQWGKCLTIGANDDVFVAGTSTGQVVFGNISLPAGAGGPLLCKYAADGTLLWVRRVEGAAPGFGIQGSANGIALDTAGNVIMTGYLHKGTADFGGTVVSVQQYDDSFTAKYNSNGAVQWVRLGHGHRGVAVDRQGDIYFTGFVFDVSGPGPMECGKFTSTGELAWVQTIPGAYGNNVALNAKGEPMFVGEFMGTLQLGEHVVQNDSTTYQDILICKADSNGNFQWAFSGGGPEFDRATAVACDKTGSCYVAGVIRGVSGSLGGFPLNVLVPGGSDSDVFLTRLIDAAAFVPELKIAKKPAGLALSWPVQATNYVLEATTSLSAVSWDAVTNTPTVGATERSVQLPITGNAKFFRLRNP